VKVAVASLQDQPTELTATESPEDLGLAAERVDFLAPVDVAVKLTRMQQDVLAQGEATTRVRMPCSRCLEDVDVELAGQFEALYVPETGSYGQRMGQPNFEWGDQRVNFYAELTIDLAEQVRQALLIELPMKPLCRPDCKGLCPECGHNLNEGPCPCGQQAEDDPWGPLRDLVPPPDPDA
jgi:uncharacterized protein